MALRTFFKYSRRWVLVTRVIDPKSLKLNPFPNAKGVKFEKKTKHLWSSSGNWGPIAKPSKTSSTPKDVNQGGVR